MIKKKQLTIRISEDLYEMAINKCNYQFEIGLSTMVKIFLRAFVSQRGVGFYVGDDDLCDLYRRWFVKKALQRKDRNASHIAGPFLKDLFNLNDKDRPHNW